MNIKQTQEILSIINASKHADLRKGLFKSAVRYAQIRAEWSFLNMEQRKDADAARSSAHDSLIDSCNILSRNMFKAGESTEWRTLLGNERKNIGDFACYLHCLIALQER